MDQLDAEEYGAIHYALESRNPVDMLRILLENGADINLNTPDESTGMICWEIGDKSIIIFSSSSSFGRLDEEERSKRFATVKPGM